MTAAHALEARVPTPQGSRYLRQLCRHWSHSLAVTEAPDAGEIRFDPRVPGGLCRLAADPGGLTLRVEAPARDAAGRLAGVVEEHLRRFAFRETLDVAWSPAR